MKKIRILIVAALFVVITAVTAFALTRAQLVSVIKGVLENVGYKCHVVIEDFDKNGVDDIIIGYAGGNESDTKASFIGSVSGSVVIPAREANFEVDKIMVIMTKKEVWVARIKHLDECYKLLESTGSKESAGICLVSAWVMIEL